MAPYSTQLSLWEKIDFTLRALLILPAAYAFCLARGLPQARSRGMGLRFVALSLLLRLVLASTNPRYLQSIAPPTRARYVRWLATKQRAVASRGEAVLRKLREDVEPVTGTDAFICWLGDRTKAAKFVLLFHGGGYIAPATKGHFEWAWNSYVDAGPGEKQEVAVAIVQYTLCPPGRYPLQLTQCCAALDMLLMRGIAPADLLFGGDSAGGNLTVQVLRHLVEPHPGIEPINLPGPVAGVFMVSPLVDGRVDARSYDDNNAVDMICKPLALQTGDEMFQQKAGGMSVAEMRALALPMEGDAAWMKEATRLQRPCTSPPASRSASSMTYWLSLSFSAENVPA